MVRFVQRQMYAPVEWDTLAIHANVILMNVQLACTHAIHRRTV